MSEECICQLRARVKELQGENDSLRMERDELRAIEKRLSLKQGKISVNQPCTLNADPTFLRDRLNTVLEQLRQSEKLATDRLRIIEDLKLAASQSPLLDRSRTSDQIIESIFGDVNIALVRTFLSEVQKKYPYFFQIVP